MSSKRRLARRVGKNELDVISTAVGYRVTAGMLRTTFRNYRDVEEACACSIDDVAHHEAAHAVAAIALDGHMHGVQLLPKPEIYYPGEVRAEKPVCEMIVALAGPAQDHLRNVTHPCGKNNFDIAGGNLGDMRKAVWCAAVAWLGASANYNVPTALDRAALCACEAYVSAAIEITVRFVSANADLIHDLSVRLLTKNRLTRSDVAEICENRIQGSADETQARTVIETLAARMKK